MNNCWKKDSRDPQRRRRKRCFSEKFALRVLCTSPLSSWRELRRGKDSDSYSSPVWRWEETSGSTETESSQKEMPDHLRSPEDRVPPK